jgi:hypothetical protein
MADESSQPNVDDKWYDKTDIHSMVSQAKVKLYGSKSRHSINPPSDFVRDSAFPFKVGDGLIAKIADGKVIIEKAND